jgi:hypothetical protein
VKTNFPSLYASGYSPSRNALLVELWTPRTLRDDGANAGNSLENRIPEYSEVTCHVVLAVRNVCKSLSLQGIILIMEGLYVGGGGICRADHATPLYSQKLALNFADKWRSLSRYSSLADQRPRSLFVVCLFLASKSRTLNASYFGALSQWRIHLSGQGLGPFPPNKFP